MRSVAWSLRDMADHRVNDEIRMTNDEANSKPEQQKSCREGERTGSVFVIRNSCVIRIQAFVVGVAAGSAGSSVAVGRVAFPSGRFGLSSGLNSALQTSSALCARMFDTSVEPGDKSAFAE